MVHTYDAVDQYLERVRVAWNGPKDFWSDKYKFSLDAGALKDMITKAFLEGYFEARLNYETPTKSNEVAPIRL